MEEKAGSEAGSSGESSVAASVSPEYLSASAAATTSSAINENIGTSYLQQTAESTTWTKVQQGVSDVEVNQHEAILSDPELSVKQNIPDVSSLDEDKHTVESYSSVTELRDVHSAAIIPPSIGAFGNGSADLSESSGKETADIQPLGDNAVSNDPSVAVQKREDGGKPTPLAEYKYQNKVGIVKENRPPLSKSEKQESRLNTNRTSVDTAAPFESVKEAVTKFGGIVDWKTHKKQTMERQKHVLSELEKVQEKIPEYKKQSEAAENAKEQVLKELGNTRKSIEELNVHLERVQTEEAQARQDSELAQLRVKEMEKGIAGESSIAVKTLQEVAKARHEAAIAELKSVKEELVTLQDKYSSLVNERDIAVRKAEEAVSLTKEIEKTVDDLTLELITIKETLESAHASHLEAEEHRIGSALTRDQDLLTWQKELKQSDEQVQQLTQQLSSTKDIQSKLDIASTTLENLKAELAAYMEAKFNEESSKEESTDDIAQTNGDQSCLEALNSTRKELEEVKSSVEKAKEEVKFLKVAAVSLKSELEKEKGALANLQQREGMASIAVSSLEDELDKIKQELEVVKMKEKEAREKMTELPKLLQQAAEEADEAKSEVQSAHENLKNAKELAEQVTASASMTEIRLQAALKEIEASKASETLALSAIKALEESEQAVDNASKESQSVVTLPLVEYFNLSMKAHEAEELAHEMVMAALAQIEEAKQLELRSFRRLEEVYREMNSRKEALRIAKEKAEKAKEGKLSAEQDLRKWRTESGQRRRSSDAVKSEINPVNSLQDSFAQNRDIKSFRQETDVFVHPVHDEISACTPESSPGSDISENKVRKKKKSLFPQFLRNLAHRNQ